MPTMSSTEIHLINRPTGWPSTSDFATVRAELPELADGEIRVSNEYISVDPYMRGRMNDVESYIPPFGLNEVMGGLAVGTVIESRAEGLGVGDAVLHPFGWREIAQGPAAEFNKVERIPGMPLSAHLGILGITAFTAYVGLLEIAKIKEGDSVFVSGAAGAVGSIAGQIARLKGAKRVIGSAGSAAKVKLLTEKYGYDAAFNYKDAPVLQQLRDAAPEGIDVYFDNVGGDHLEAALDSFNNGGRGALCGAISTYNSIEAVAGPSNIGNMVPRELTLQGFIIGNYFEHLPAFTADMTAWLAEGKIVFDETVVEGLENSVDAFINLMHGANTGKMVVKL